MKSRIFTLVCIVAALCACGKENPKKKHLASTNVFTATTSDISKTKAVLDGVSPTWEIGDVINIDGHAYTATSAGKTATFSGSGATEEIHHAYFPANLYSGGVSTLPATQTYVPGKFNIPMSAKSTTSDLQFINICALIAVKVTSEDIAVLKSIKVKSDKALCGEFHVRANEAHLVDESDNSKTVELVSETALTLDAEGTVFYIALPPQVYKYLNIYLSPDGLNYTKVMASTQPSGLEAFRPGEIYEFDYVNNASKLWEGSLFVADCNIGATTPNDHGNYYTWGGCVNVLGETDTYYRDGDLPLSGDDDTATKVLGLNWRLPTDDEFNQLFDTTEWIDTEPKGLLCSGKDIYSANTIFIPAASYWDVKEPDAIDMFEYFCFYWTSLPWTDDSYGDKQALCMYAFGTRSFQYVNPQSRANGLTVRAVLDE